MVTLGNIFEYTCFNSIPTLRICEPVDFSTEDRMAE